MYKKLSQLGFVIGLFFIIVSLILFGNVLLKQEADRMSLFTAIVFLLFGIMMILLDNRKNGDSR